MQAECKVKAHFQTLLRRSCFSKQSFKERPSRRFYAVRITRVQNIARGYIFICVTRRLNKHCLMAFLLILFKLIVIEFRFAATKIGKFSTIFQEKTGKFFEKMPF